MNYRSIIFSGIMSALVFAMIGLAIGRIAQKVERRKVIVIGGATLGFAIGVFQQAVIEHKNQRREYEEENLE
jgi:acyl-[acyl carrier protein]--UDP-N-acetylglucosamine O-acyltransferase